MDVDATTPGGPSLAPLPYHADVVDHLRRHEPEIWAWAGSVAVRESHVEQVRTSLLRGTYRLERDAHPAIHEQLALAMRRLGLDLPATLYQAGGERMGAALVFIPGEIHLVLEGQTLDRLEPDELLALFGHELAHHLLWSRDGGAFHVADRVLHDAAASTRAVASHLETCRRYRLHTELFADRGAAVAATALAPAVSLLVKMHTGIARPDPAAYLRQAAEIDARDDGTGDAGHTHPEAFVRARALALWWEGAPGVEDWIEATLHGRLSLERLDLPGQHRLQALTRGFLAHVLDEPALRGERVLGEVRTLFPDWGPDEPPLAPAALLALRPDDGVRQYLAALLLDVALVEPELRDALLARAWRIAPAFEVGAALEAGLRRDARFGKRELDRLRKQAGARA